MSHPRSRTREQLGRLTLACHWPSDKVQVCSLTFRGPCAPWLVLQFHGQVCNCSVTITVFINFHLHLPPALRAGRHYSQPIKSPNIHPDSSHRRSHWPGPEVQAQGHRAGPSSAPTTPHHCGAISQARVYLSLSNLSVLSASAAPVPHIS